MSTGPSVNLEGKVVLSGVGQVEQDEFLFNLLHEQVINLCKYFENIMKLMYTFSFLYRNRGSRSLLQLIIQ